MEVVEKVLSVAHIIYAQCEQVKCCKHQCRRLVYRIHILLRPVEVLRAQPPKQISSQVEETLQQLLETLEKAQELVKKYSQTNWLQKFLKASDVVEGFARVNERLGDAAQGLSLLLQAEHKQSFLETFQRDTCSREDSQDTKDDKAHWEELLTRSTETKDAVDNIHKDVRHVGSKVEDVGSRVEEVRQMVQKCKLASGLSPLGHTPPRVRVGCELLTLNSHPPGSGTASSLEGFAVLMDRLKNRWSTWCLRGHLPTSAVLPMLDGSLFTLSSLQNPTQHPSKVLILPTAEAFPSVITLSLKARSLHCDKASLCCFCIPPPTPLPGGQG
nr:mixed lineage kinase domain-like protein [Chelonoidis abingdonii]